MTLMKAEDYIQAWTDMNPELEKEDPGIRLAIPSLERTEEWINETPESWHNPTTGQCG